TKPESFGRAVLEALSLGVPVIGYDHGGVGEILARLYPHGAVPIHRSDFLLQAVIKCIHNYPKPKPQYQFNKDKMLTDTLDLYTNLNIANL
ncbi:MAG: glycosyltransferase, partial [Gammaproteobacteria bacterium]|nr:glycosyltransferase [Gammaproteobacteria bacterium]